MSRIDPGLPFRQRDGRSAGSSAGKLDLRDKLQELTIGLGNGDHLVAYREPRCLGIDAGPTSSTLLGGAGPGLIWTPPCGPRLTAAVDQLGSWQGKRVQRGCVIRGWYWSDINCISSWSGSRILVALIRVHASVTMGASTDIAASAPFVLTTGAGSKENGLLLLDHSI